MPSSLPAEELLRCAIHVVGRIAVPKDDLAKVVAVNPKLFAAYNLCDGTRTQAEIQKTAKLDSGNFSRTVARWISLGVVFKLGQGRDATLLHVYPLDSEFEPARRRKGRDR